MIRYEFNFSHVFNLLEIIFSFSILLFLSTNSLQSSYNIYIYLPIISTINMVHLLLDTVCINKRESRPFWASWRIDKWLSWCEYAYLPHH